MTNEDAIKWLSNLKQDIGQSRHEDLWPYAQAIDETIIILEEQEAVELNEWIKCSDRMPEEQETIFAKFKGTDKWSPAMFAQSSEDVRVVIVFADGTKRVSHSHTVDGRWECEKSPVKRIVTHWMPNPELPKDGD